jgi:simple sugar transport system substrate-binding protein
MYTRMKVVSALGVVALGVSACGSGNSNGGGGGGGSSASASNTKDMKIVTVVKLLGVGWFDRMNQGIKEFATETGAKASMTGADDASPEKQIKIIQDLIAERPTAITVVPNSPEALEGVLKQAQSAGIKVVTHEASNQQNTDVDIEAFNNPAYGAHIMDNLADCMGGKGKYAAFVGQLTARSHMEWVKGALDHAKEKYPGVQRIGGPIEGREDASVAYQKTKELLAKHPDIKGIEGSAATDVAGVGRAIQEAGLQDKVCVMGTSIPSIASKYLDTGAIDKIFFWDPALAGKAQDKLAVMLAKGEEVKPGLNLGVKGYENLQKIPGSPHGLAGNAWIDVDKSNASEYAF